MLVCHSRKGALLQKFGPGCCSVHKVLVNLLSCLDNLHHNYCMYCMYSLYVEVVVPRVCLRILQGLSNPISFLQLFPSTIQVIDVLPLQSPITVAWGSLGLTNGLARSFSTQQTTCCRRKEQMLLTKPARGIMTHLELCKMSLSWGGIQFSADSSPLDTGCANPTCVDLS